MNEKQLDYLFDLQGYLVLKGAIAKDDLQEMNRWVDDKWSYVEEAMDDGPGFQGERWIGEVELHSYSQNDGVNFQNIIAGGPVFERLIDYPAWLPMVKRYVNPVNGLSIHENLLNVRSAGGHLYLHCGGHAPLSYLTFRQTNTGEWMVGQINILIALNDVGPGDGPTVLVPGSHKCTEIHPRLEVDGKGVIALDDGRAAGTAFGTQEVYLEAGDALFFTDAITHGSAQRTNPGHRRVVIYRYSPRFLRTRFNYQLSERLLSGLTPERRAIIQPIPPRQPVGI